MKPDRNETNSLKFLALTRHGDYDDFRGMGSDTPLSKVGRENTTLLAERLGALVEGMQVKLLHSTVERAAESAAIIAKVLDVRAEPNTILGHPANDNPLSEDIWPVVRDASCEALILVGHVNMTRGLPVRAAEELFGRLQAPMLGAGYSTARIIDVPQQKIYDLSWDPTMDKEY